MRWPWQRRVPEREWFPARQAIVDEMTRLGRGPGSLTVDEVSEVFEFSNRENREACPNPKCTQQGVSYRWREPRAAWQTDRAYCLCGYAEEPSNGDWHEWREAFK